MGDKTALFGGFDHPFDGGVGKIEQRAVRGFRNGAFLIPLLVVLLRHKT